RRAAARGGPPRPRLGGAPRRRGARSRNARGLRATAARLQRRPFGGAHRRPRWRPRRALPRRVRADGRPHAPGPPERGPGPAARARGDLQGAWGRARAGAQAAQKGGGMREVTRTESASAPFQGAPYSQAIKANGFVFVSGQLSLRPDHAEIVGDDITEQTEQVLANLRAILEAAGSGLDRLLETTLLL